MSFAELLRNLRAGVNLTQSELAVRAGVGIRTLRDIERGHVVRPQRATVDLLADALDLIGADRVAFEKASRGFSTPTMEKVEALIGRDEAVAELTDLLDVADLVTLVGVAGVGKTSLATATAHQLAGRYPGGVASIPVTDAVGRADVLSAVVAAFNASRFEELPARLAGRPALLLVDALERSPVAVAGAVARLRAHLPSLRILATGRHPMNLPGEYQRPVVPLDGMHGTELFLARLRRVRSHALTHTERVALPLLVEKLGGLPYALELAAARGRVLSVSELLQRYGDRVLDLGLRASVAGSYQILAEPDQRILRLLAAFANRWSMELAEELAGADLLFTVDKLVTLGLVSVLPGTDLRFRLLDVVRDYASEQTPPAELAELRARHAALIAHQVAGHAAHLVGAGQRAAIARLAELYGEIRYALVWGSEHDPAAALRIAVQLPRYWRFRGNADEGAELLTHLLADPRAADVEPVTRARATVGRIMLAHALGRATGELHQLEQAIKVFATEGDVADELQAHGLAAGICHAQGDYDTGYEHTLAGVELARRSGRPRDMVVAQNNLIWYDVRICDFPAARARLEQAERVARQIDDTRLLVITRANLAEIARMDSRFADAILAARQALPLVLEIGEPGTHMRLLCTVALAYAADGRLDDAVAVLADLRARPGYAANRAVRGLCTSVEGYVAQGRGDRLTAARRFATAVEELAGQHDSRDTLEAMVGLAVTTDDPVERADALLRLEQLRTTLGVSLTAREQAALASLL